MEGIPFTIIIGSSCKSHSCGLILQGCCVLDSSPLSIHYSSDSSGLRPCSLTLSIDSQARPVAPSFGQLQGSCRRVCCKEALLAGIPLVLRMVVVFKLGILISLQMCKTLALHRLRCVL